MAHVTAHDLDAIAAALYSLAEYTAELTVAAGKLATAADKLADDIDNLRLAVEAGTDYYERSAA